MRVFYTESILLSIQELTDILYEKEYFGFTYSAKKYVSSLMRELETNIYLKQKRKASSYFSHYGQNLWYVFYSKNKRTTWYFFFTYHPNEDIYFICYLTNNHVEGHFI